MSFFLQRVTFFLQQVSFFLQRVSFFFCTGAIFFAHQCIRRYFESAAIQHQLRSKRIELIFFDEFSLNSRHMKHRGCALKGNKGYTKMDSSGFSMSLLVALSDVRVYGIMGWSSSVENNVVRLFVTYLLSFRNQTPSITNSPFALVCDNVSEHVWDRMAKF